MKKVLKSDSSGFKHRVTLILKARDLTPRCLCEIFTGEMFLWRFFNPQAPIAHRIADEVVFRHFQSEAVAFFLIGPH